MGRKSLGLGVFLAMVLMPLTAAPLHAAFVIDNFAVVSPPDSSPQFLLVGPGGVSPPSLTSAAAFNSAGAVGAIRDMVVTRTVGMGFLSGDVSNSVTNGFSFGSGLALGSARIIYDANSTHMVTTSPGLNPPNGVDLTQGGVNTGISTSGLSAEGGITLTINLYTDSTHESTGTATLAIGQPNPMGTNLAPIFIPFASFVPTGGSGSADLSHIRAIEVILDNGTDPTMHTTASGTIGPIIATGQGVVPAPPGAVLLLTGLAVGAVYRRRAARRLRPAAAIPT
jgi:hypothetical protein